MGKKVFLLAFFPLLFFGCTMQAQAPLVGLQKEPVFSEQVFFCPEDKCAFELIEKIDSAKESIDIAIYSFTLDEIADSLIDAKRRGVKVRVLFDAGQAQSKYSEDEHLAENGVEVKRLDKSSGIMHNKFAVIDSVMVSTGSFNYSNNANEFNDENLVFLYGEETVEKFRQEFEELWVSS